MQAGMLDEKQEGHYRNSSRRRKNEEIKGSGRKTLRSMHGASQFIQTFIGMSRMRVTACQEVDIIVLLPPCDQLKATSAAHVSSCCSLPFPTHELENVL